MAFQKFVPKDEIKNYSIEKFPGKIFVIEKEEDVAAAYSYLKNKKIIGFDTESKPTFKKGVTSKVSLIQFSTENQAFLFRINKIGFKEEIIHLMSSKK